jgi:hypothetical protein
MPSKKKSPVPTKAKAKASAAAKGPTPAQVVKEIRKRFGDVIDLKSSPALMLEILNEFRHALDPEGGGGTGGVSPGTSTVAVGITPPASALDQAAIQELLKSVLKLQKQVSTMSKQLDRMGTSK